MSKFFKSSILALAFAASSALAQPFVAPNPSPANLKQAQMEIEARLGQPVTQFREISKGFVAFEVQSASVMAASVVNNLVARVPGMQASPRVKRHAVMPNDPLFAQNQAAYFNVGQPGSSKLGEALGVATGTANTVVAVLDTGIVAHPDLRGRVLPGYDFISSATSAGDGDGRDNNAQDAGDFTTDAESAELGCFDASSSWHGTRVAGVIAANADNGAGIAGGTFNTQVLPVRILGKCGGVLTDVVDGMRWAAGLPVVGAPLNPNPAKILNMSLGGTIASCPAFLQAAVDEIIASGAVIVASTGNDGSSSIDAPANCAGVISVGANIINGAKANYANFSPNTTLATFGGGAGVGVAVTTETGATVPTGQYGEAFAAGTSFSAPLVSAALALGYQIAPNQTPEEVKALLSSTVDTYPVVDGLPSCQAGVRQGACNCSASVCGGGLLNAQAYVNALRADQLVVNSNPSVALNAQGFNIVSVPLKASFSKTMPAMVDAFVVSEVSKVGGFVQNGQTLEFTKDGEYLLETSATDSSGATARSQFMVAVSNIGTNVPLPPTPVEPEVPEPGTDPTSPPADGGGGGGGGSSSPFGLLLMFAALMAFKRKYN